MIVKWRDKAALNENSVLWRSASKSYRPWGVVDHYEVSRFGDGSRGKYLLLLSTRKIYDLHSKISRTDLQRIAAWTSLTQKQTSSRGTKTLGIKGMPAPTESAI